MSCGISPIDHIRADIDGTFTGDRDLAGVLQDVARPWARPTIQAALKSGEFPGQRLPAGEGERVVRPGLHRHIAGGHPRRRGALRVDRRVER
ncbi:hypothetical protein [Sinosporangium siamense]|uniref:Uncharacterized protein n=1 Tax=Sinosporangium siamense TaxID=1367973 RepID=A0A919R9Y0_9ACTN|nr:hypothetical protein [Sinosporangium siamense]GII90043.1 hypothetical protein Ssi02_02740 [Sinosporangium siamense]